MISSDFDTAFKKASSMNHRGNITMSSFERLYYHNFTDYEDDWSIVLISGTKLDLMETDIEDEDMLKFIRQHNIYEKARESSKT